MDEFTKIKVALAQKNENLTWLAKQLGMSKQNVTHHMNNLKEGKYDMEFIEKVNKILPLKILSDSEIDMLVFCAFRYTLKRQSYVVKDVCEIIIKSWDSLQSNTKDVLVSEIKEYIKQDCSESNIKYYKEILRRAE